MVAGVALTDDDNRYIAWARELAALITPAETREYLIANDIMTSDEPEEATFGFAFGSARYLLLRLADVAERLGEP